MRVRPLKLFVSMLLVIATMSVMAGVAAADEFATDAPNPVTSTQAVQVWLASVTGEGPWDTNAGGCNVGNTNDSLSVTAEISSSDPAVTVSPTTMTFGGCGSTLSQTLSIKVTTGLCNVSGTVSITETSVSPNHHAVKGAFNTETIQVTAAGSNPTDPSCGGPGPNPGTCSEPAAPAWAAALLKASNLKPKPNGPNYVSLVAQHMTQGAMFDGVPKSDQGPGSGDTYPIAVRNYMVNTLGLAGLATVDSARLIRPGWDCVPLV